MLAVPNRRLNGLAALELPLLTFVHRFDAASMHHLNTGIGGRPRAIGIHAAVTQIHEGLFDFAAHRFDQVITLTRLSLFREKSINFRQCSVRKWLMQRGVVFVNAL